MGMHGEAIRIRAAKICRPAGGGRGVSTLGVPSRYGGGGGALRSLVLFVGLLCLSSSFPPSFFLRFPEVWSSALTMHRKHTGERPFTCHCSKQFSRLDNLRQHAQTVHSAPEDKPLNERMMRALSGINASMMAGVRGRRRYGAGSADAASAAMAGSSYSSSSPSPASSSSSPASSPYTPEAPYVHGYASMHAHGGYPSGSHSLPASPSYPAFPAHAHEYTSPPHSGFDSPASLFDSPATDYLSVTGLGAASVKQEEGLEEFYKALHGPSSYASSSSLESMGSLSRAKHSASPMHQHAYHQSQGGSPYPPSSTSTGSSPSPVGSPRAEAFWPSQPAPQQPPRGREYLPSPPESPAYYATAHRQGSYGWAAAAGDGEMSNAQYYAALQGQRPPHGHISPPAAAHQQQEGYFYSAHSAPGYVYA
ncbi:hypothetical protein GGX14DRAFT_569187 [Mycena pura]|uniref:C2H2-type domain-containing protein n=1 Tax=Mycena pura TaxID=153505 RepID=A0AAD6VER8_9AGAR|nr:hypothetical protein GGX14DRAFT_569187 [Mycena pura]